MQRSHTTSFNTLRPQPTIVGWGLSTDVSRETIADDRRNQKRNDARIDGTTVTHSGSRSRTRTHPDTGAPQARRTRGHRTLKPSPPPLAHCPREEPVPRREDPGEHEAGGEHQDDRGARGHVQRPRQVQAHEATRSPEHG